MDDPRTDDEFLFDEIMILRRLLAVRVAGAMLYADDGELQDCSALPHIDFKRDCASCIEQKLQARGLAALEAPHG